MEYAIALIIGTAVGLLIDNLFHAARKNRLNKNIENKKWNENTPFSN